MVTMTLALNFNVWPVFINRHNVRVPGAGIHLWVSDFLTAMTSISV